MRLPLSLLFMYFTVSRWKIFGKGKMLKILFPISFSLAKIINYRPTCYKNKVYKNIRLKKLRTCKKIKNMLRTYVKALRRIK